MNTTLAIYCVSRLKEVVRHPSWYELSVKNWKKVVNITITIWIRFLRLQHGSDDVKYKYFIKSIIIWSMAYLFIHYAFKSLVSFYVDIYSVWKNCDMLFHHLFGVFCEYKDSFCFSRSFFICYHHLFEVQFPVFLKKKKKRTFHVFLFYFGSVGDTVCFL